MIRRLQEPPLLYLPDNKGRPHLHSNTINLAMGSVLYQIQNNKPKWITHKSKIMPEVAKNYFITELELCGLAINIASLAHLLKKVDFDAIVDHLALTNIIKIKTEPPTNKMKRLLEVLGSYLFNQYYIKEKEM